MTKAGECPLAKSEDAKVTSQVPPGLLNISGARLEVFRRLASAGPGKDVEVKDLDKAHHNPSLRLEETLLQDEQEATASQPPEGPEPRREFPRAGVFRSGSSIEQEPIGSGASKGQIFRRQESTDAAQSQEEAERTKTWRSIQT